MKLSNAILPAAFLAIALTAGPAKARDYGEVAGWQLASAGESCGLLSTRAGNGEILILRRLDGALHLQVSSNFWETGDGTDIRYAIDGREWEGAIGVAPVSEGEQKGYIAAFAPDFADLLRAGNRLSVKDGSRTLGIYSLAGSAAGLNRLEACLADLRRDGPAKIVTAEEIAAATITPARPQGGAGRWFSMSDYPGRALRDGREGTVGFRLTIGTNGRVTDCVVMRSSGHTDIDESTCKAATRRARFDPAVNGNGEKVEGRYDGSVTWRVPE